MTLRLISATGFPAYTALSTDISGSAIKGAILVGKTVYILDAQKWYIINQDGLLLENFVIPETISGSKVFIDGGNVTISGSIITGSSIEVTNFPNTYSGSITNLPDIQKISGSINILNVISASLVAGGSAIWVNDGNITVDNVISASLVAGGSSVAVSNFPVIQPISGSISIDNFPESLSNTSGSKLLITTDGEVLEGTINKLNVTDISVEDLLNDILKELMKMNVQLSLLTDTLVSGDELE